MAPDSPVTTLRRLLAALDRRGLTVPSALAGCTTVAPDWRFRDRALDEHLLYLPLTGSYRWSLDGRSGLLGPGSLLWLPPGCRHSVWVDGAGRRLTLHHFRFRIRAGRREVRLAAPIILAAAPPLRLWAGLWLDAHRTPGAQPDLRRAALLILLTTGLLDALTAPPQAGRLSPTQRQRLERWADERLGQALPPGALAAAAGRSPAYFRRRFRATYGCPPRTWLLRRRLERACWLLRTGEQPISEIARDLGWRSLPLFCRAFKAHTGQSPGAWRRS